jgi:hypothetical protein
MKELHQECPNGSSANNEYNAGNPGRLAVNEAQDLSQVIQHPFTVWGRMMSAMGRTSEKVRGGLLAATRSKRSIPRRVIEVCLILEPVPHGVDVKPNFIWTEESKGPTAIG